MSYKTVKSRKYSQKHWKSFPFKNVFDYKTLFDVDFNNLLNENLIRWYLQCILRLCIDKKTYYSTCCMQACECNMSGAMRALPRITKFTWYFKKALGYLKSANFKFDGHLRVNNAFSAFKWLFETQLRAGEEQGGAGRDLCSERWGRRGQGVRETARRAPELVRWRMLYDWSRDVTLARAAGDRGLTTDRHSVRVLKIETARRTIRVTNASCRVR